MMQLCHSLAKGLYCWNHAPMKSIKQVLPSAGQSTGEGVPAEVLEDVSSVPFEDHTGVIAAH